MDQLEAPETTETAPILPGRVRRALDERGCPAEDLLTAARTDLDIGGDFAESWVILMRDRVLVFLIDEEEDTALLKKEISLQDISAARTDSRVGSGFLEIKTDSVFEELARFSNKNADKFAKVAAQIKLLAEGKPVEQLPPVAEEPEDALKRHGLEKPEKGAVFFRFLARTKAYWPYTAMAMVFVVATILLQLVPAQLTRILVDNVFGDVPRSPWFESVTELLGLRTRLGWLVALVIGLALVTLLTSAVSVLRERLSVRISNRLGYELRRDMFNKLEDMAIRYHDTHPVGRLMTRCTQDIETLQTFIPQLTSGFGYQIILVVAVVCVMFTMSWKLTLLAIFPAPFVMMCTYTFTKYITPGWRKFWTTRSNLSNGLHGALHGIRVVKAFAQEGRESNRFDGSSSAYRDAGLKVGYANALFYPFAGFLFQIGGFVVWLYGGWKILQQTGPPTGDEMTIGYLIAFLGYLGMFYAPLNSLTQMSTWFTQFVTQAHRVFEVLDEPPEIKETNESIDVEIQGHIRCDKVTFGYDPHIPVLQEVSLEVHPGEMIGIVGHSGCGKSTLVNLILRFYETQEGIIAIDNTDIRRIRKNCLRRQIGLVAQDPFLFPGTVAENIAYGNPGVAPELILNASVAANAHMFVTRNHDGYDARLGERGAGLSGGERQRVAIARALLHNPRILILDEATSAVDAISEREIQKALEALSLGRTTIAIAHRLSTLRNCDRILVFEEGMVREAGSHEELMARKGIYYKLVEIQSQMSDRVDVLNTERTQPLVVETPDRRAERSRMRVPQVEYLDPQELHVFSRDEGDMRVEYKGAVYDHVRAYRCFPISRPNEFIALWTGESTLEHREIGMIRRLKEIAPSSSIAVEHELAKRYFIHYIRQIKSIKEELAFLQWEVVTSRGEMSFYTYRWERDTVVEGGTNGRVITDLDDNRFEIEDMDQLDAESRAKFMKYIYW